MPHEVEYVSALPGCDSRSDLSDPYAAADGFPPGDLTVFRREIKSRFVRSFLAYIPYAVLGAMTFPDVFYSTGDMRTAICGVAVAVLLAWRGRSLLTVAVAACVAVALAQGFLLLV